MLIINADDWGRDPVATDTTLACFQAGSISSASAMVFLPDSERAAELAKQENLKIGLHINFTQEFSDTACPPNVLASQRRIRKFLTRSKYALVLYNPFLRSDFRVVFEAQLKEFQRLYGQAPSHFDGHQHMHLATNMLVQRLIPAGVTVRRSFSFRPGEKGRTNIMYRRLVDRFLARHYRIADFFFALASNLDPGRFQKVVEISEPAAVELMTHCWNHAEFGFLKNLGSLQAVKPAEIPGLTTGCEVKVN